MTGELVRIASTILSRSASISDESTTHSLRIERSEKQIWVAVGSTEGGPSLFVLTHETVGRTALSSFDGRSESWTLAELAEATPDPLWESADGICSHMEDDHSDTFGLFLTLAGRADLADCKTVTMPWVQSDGFYLTADSQHVFVPFPKRCEDPNSVRATLILMLRGARAANVSH